MKSELDNEYITEQDFRRQVREDLGIPDDQLFHMNLLELPENDEEYLQFLNAMKKMIKISKTNNKDEIDID